MKTLHFLIELKDHFKEEDWSWLLLALRQDRLVWESLQESDLRNAAKKELGEQARMWSPAALALLDVQIPATLDGILSEPARPLAPAVGRLVERAFQDWKEEPIPESTSLARAGLLALALRERRRQSDSWEEVWQELPDHIKDNPILPSVLACLPGLTAEPASLLNSLMGVALPANLVVHAFLSQPLPPHDQLSFLEGWIKDLPPVQIISLIDALSLQRKELGVSLAKWASEKGVISAGEQGKPISPLPPQGCAEQLEALVELQGILQAVELNRLSDQTSTTIALLDKAIKATRRIQAPLAAHLGEVAGQSPDPKRSLEAWKQAVQLAPHWHPYSAGLAQALLKAGRPGDAQAYLSARQSEANQPTHASLLLVNAQVAARLGEAEAARQTALQALELVENDPNLSTGDPNLVRELARLLMELDAPGEASRAASLIMEAQPNDEEMLVLLAHAYLAAGFPDQALQPALVALTIHPEDAALRRILVESLEKTDEWGAALNERRLLMQMLQAEGAAPQVRELCDLARCAVKAGYPEQAIQACQDALEIAPEDGAVYAILGEATLARGEKESARSYFHQATQRTPQLADSWLALAEIYHSDGDTEKALETLRAASQAAPDNPHIHLALGEAYETENAPTQALASYRKAAEIIGLTEADTSPAAKSIMLSPASQQGELFGRVALQLGKTLHQLGHLSQARQIFEQACFFRSQNGLPSTEPADYISPAFAYAYAKTLVELHESKAAIEPLKIVVQSNPDDPAPYLEYARALLQNPEEGNAQRALPYLERLLALAPGHEEGQALQAEALASAGELQKALDAYRKALDTPLAEQPDWRARLSYGLGRTALSLKHIETAQAALQEAAQIEPQNPAIQQALAEACLANGLVDDSLQAARSSLRLNPSDLSTLTWFAEFAKRLPERAGGNHSQLQIEAVQALRRASQLAPQRADLHVGLGKLLLQNGNRTGALEAFRNVALVEAGGSPARLVDLFEAARNLRVLGDREHAAEILERAIAHQPTTSSKTRPVEEDGITTLDLYSELANVQRESGDHKAAIHSLDEAIGIKPSDAMLHMAKANLMLEMGNPGEALSCLEEALTLVPEGIDPEQHAHLHLSAARLLRTTGNLPAAFAQAESASSLNGEAAAAGMHMAADISRAILQPAQARLILSAGEVQAAPRTDSLDLACLRAELALEAGEDASAEVAVVRELAPQHPRSLAAQARLVVRRGDYPAAATCLHSALQAAQAFSQETPPLRLDPMDAHVELPMEKISIWYSLAEAALELENWEIALEMARNVVTAAAQEPLSHLLWVRALTLRAEAQQLCQALDVFSHAPGEQSISEDTYQAALAALNTAGHQLQFWADSASNPSYQENEIQRWQARCQNAFRPSLASAQALERVCTGPEDVAALVSALARLDETAAAARAALAYPQHPQVMMQLALAIQETNPRQALTSIKTSLQAAAQNHFQRPMETPMLHYLHARILNAQALQAKEFAVALQAIQLALTLWPDEPRWHALAAEISQKAGSEQQPVDIKTAIHHLEKAAELEPMHAAHFISLGKAYLQHGDPASAIEALEQACKAAPDDPQPWLSLAKIYHEMGDLENAGYHAERAIERSDQPVEALLVSGEVALQAKNPRGAQSRAQAMLHLDPESPEGLYLMARALEGLNQPEEALAALEKAIPNVQEPLPLLLERSRLLRSAKGLEAALQALQDLTSYYPDEPALLAPMAELLVAAGKPEAAVQAARQALQGEAAPLPDEMQSDLHHLIGRQLRRTGQLDQSIHHLNAAIRQSPAKLEPYLELGQAYQDRREYSQAIKIFEQAMGIARDDHRPYYFSAIALKEGKDYLGAETMLRKAAERAPEDIAIQRMLGAVVAINLVHNRHQMSSR